MQLPLSLTPRLLCFAVPPQTFLLKVSALIGIFCLGLLIFSLDKRVGGLVVAGLGFDIALFEDALGLVAEGIEISVGGAHEMYSGCAKFHYNKFILY